MFDDPMKYGYICHIIVILLLTKTSNAYEKEFVFYFTDWYLEFYEDDCSVVCLI